MHRTQFFLTETEKGSIIVVDEGGGAFMAYFR